MGDGPGGRYGAGEGGRAGWIGVGWPGTAGMSIMLYRCVAHPREERFAVQRHTDQGWQPAVELTPWR